MTNGRVDEKRKRVYTGCAETKRLAGRPFLFPADHQPNSLAQKRWVLSCGGAGYAVHSFRSQQPNSKVRPNVFAFLEVEAMEGYVYIIKAETGHYKIGRSKNVPERMKLFAVKLPFDFEIIHVFPCEDMYRAEKELHIIHAESRANGEWFNLTEEEIGIIKRVHRFEQRNFVLPNGDGIPELWERLPDNYWRQLLAAARKRS